MLLLITVSYNPIRFPGNGLPGRFANIMDLVVRTLTTLAANRIGQGCVLLT